MGPVLSTAKWVGKKGLGVVAQTILKENTIIAEYLGDVITTEEYEQKFEEGLETHSLPDPDLLIRTSGECRLSNFLLWQCAYSEFVFTQTLWPDFGKAELITAIEEFHQRERRYGGSRG